MGGGLLVDMNMFSGYGYGVGVLYTRPLILSSLVLTRFLNLGARLTHWVAQETN